MIYNNIDIIRIYNNIYIDIIINNPVLKGWNEKSLKLLRTRKQESTFKTLIYYFKMVFENSKTDR